MGRVAVPAAAAVALGAREKGKARGQEAGHYKAI